MADAAVAAELIKPSPEAGPLELSSAQVSLSFAANLGGAWSVQRYLQRGREHAYDCAGGLPAAVHRVPQPLAVR